MYKIKLGLAASRDFGIPVEEQIPMLKKIGFEAFATGCDSDEELAKYRRCADECNMEYNYIHAPYHNTAKMWTDDAECVVAELVHCADMCAALSVPIMVMHAYFGFDDCVVKSSKENCDTGIKNFRRVFEHARSLGVRVAIENTEGEEYLAILMSEFSDFDNVGFCLDTGHQMCYNFGRDMTALYGDRLLVTHINDNLGVRDFSGKLTWHDDLHLLPFDGIGDFAEIARCIARSAPIGTLMLELVKDNKPDRLHNEKYMRMSLEEYMSEAYARACRVGSMVLGERNKQN